MTSHFSILMFKKTFEKSDKNNTPYFLGVVLVIGRVTLTECDPESTQREQRM